MNTPRQFFWILLMSPFVPSHADALTVTAPASGVSTIQAGDDFATQVVGDAWDMSNAQDIDTDESTNLDGPAFSGGVFSASATNCSAGVAFYPQFTGDGANIVAIKRGPRFPIDTSKYRYFTIKFKTSTSQPDRILFLKDGDSYSTGTFGSGVFKTSNANAWSVQSWDLYTDTYTPAQGYQPWTSFPQVQGIRFDPCNSGSVSLNVDWIRLTAQPGPAQSFTVTWSDTVSSTYTITAIDADNARYQFATGVSGTSYAADFSRLAPGDYHIEVKRADATTATSGGTVHVNTPPQVSIISPSIRGEQSLSYALVEKGSQWAVPMNNADFSFITNFKNVVYNNPAFSGSFYGRPTNGDPQWVMNTSGHPVDANYYRSACFTLEVFGERSVQFGSVGRLFWGINSTSVSITKDIVLSGGLAEYCLPDLADTQSVPLEPGSPQPWAGNLGYFRLDPDEWTPANGCNTPETCHDVRLDSVYLSPFAEADPSYTIRWTTTDSDYSSGGSVQLFLDRDRSFGNGSEFLLTTLAYGATSYTFSSDTHPDVPNGAYNVVVLANDGTNSVTQYSGGPLIVHSDVIFANGFGN